MAPQSLRACSTTGSSGTAFSSARSSNLFPQCMQNDCSSSLSIRVLFPQPGHVRVRMAMIEEMRSPVIWVIVGETTEGPSDVPVTLK